ncbi:ankyrin repeat domain-containing protein [Pedobacter steynii]|uniref:Uncharacterized protein n=1 Tax=Pedobacter steynii TaxID=430522 RepID=A0A1D7QMT6_9SPHI|nr:ankyrin repeat domain-containing protein [Pedobacter steynii]AOM79982.1 hypothetical protein BFS30_24145 [Pedobacter steynii]
MNKRFLCLFLLAAVSFSDVFAQGGPLIEKMFLNVRERKYEPVKKYISAGKNLNLRAKGNFRGGLKKDDKDYSNLDWTLLMLVSEHNKIDLVKQLIARKADLNAKNGGGHTALFLACASDHPEVAALLINNGAKVTEAGSDPNGMTALQWALNYGRSDLAALLLKKGAEVNRSSTNSGETILMTALKKKAISGAVVSTILDKTADPDQQNEADGTTALMWACHENDTLSIKKLLKRKVAVNALSHRRESALCYAAANKGLPVAVMELLIRAGATVNLGEDGGVSPLIAAVNNGDLIKIKFLISKSSDVNYKSERFDGVSALSAAVKTGNYEITEYLIRNGADVNLTNNYGAGILLEAASNPKNLKIVQLLIAKGATIDLADKTGKTPLMRSIENNRYEIAMFLISRGANTTVKDQYGYTPKILAAETMKRTGDKRWNPFINQKVLPVDAISKSN